ncbi:MAG: FHA domain-containing protein [Pseudomonadota bacterium]
MQRLQASQQPKHESDTLGHNTSDTEAVNITLLRSLRNQSARLTLIYQGRTTEFTPGPHVLMIGRSRDCDIVLKDRHSSRKHARVVCRKGKFVLIDHSTNGSFISMNGLAEICLVEQDQLLLTGSGVIGLGRSTAGDQDQLIHFSCHYASQGDDPSE